MNFFDNFKKKNLIVAHRGYSEKFPENTLISFQNAIGKADFIEFDVQLTKDYIPVVIHDETLQRTSNVSELKDYLHIKPWNVCDFDYRQLRELDFSSWFTKNKIKKVQRIMTLDEMLYFAIENDLYLNLELKDISYSKTSSVFVDIVLYSIEKFKCKNRVLISSFNHDYLKDIQSKKTDINIAVLEYNRISDDLVNYLKSFNAIAYHIDDETVSKELITSLNKNDIYVNVYTVNDESRKKELFSMGVKAIFTDCL